MTGPERRDHAVTFADGSVGWISGHLFAAEGERRGILQVLLHGNSYDHRYWDAGPGLSYARWMAARGHDVLAVDLPGTGSSSRPDGDAVTVDALADGLAGLVAGFPTHRIALVGHSLGTILAVAVQARNALADVLVGTGTGWAPNRFPPPFGPGVREAALSTEYAALPPAERARVFYHPPTADPETIAYDNRVLRTTMPRSLWSAGLRLRDHPASGIGEVRCPVLLQLGEFDPIMPASLAAAERAHWPATAHLLVEELPEVGHSFALHHPRVRGWEGIERFLG